ncbi:MAG: diacylglycerol kinase family protein [Acetobacteraceae bacterium]
MMIVRTLTPDSCRSQLLWQVLDLLAANGLKLDLADATCPGEAETLAREAALRGARMVVAAGDDNLVLDVAQGLVGTDVRLGVIPSGRVNQTARALGLPLKPRAVAAALAFGRTRPFWPGLVTGAEGRRLFVQTVGVGFDAEVFRCLPFALRGLCGKGVYAMQSLREMLRYEFPPLRLCIDGRPTSTTSAIISKAHRWGRPAGVSADPGGHPGFSVTLIDRGGPPAALLYGAAHAVNLLERAPGVRHVRAHAVTMADQQRLPAHTDGQFSGYTPLSVADVPAPLQVVTG